jgi:hypothetical protein
MVDIKVIDGKFAFESYNLSAYGSDQGGQGGR